MKTLRRIAPALALLIIAPLIAEFLLGDFNIRQLGYLAVFIPVYGAGALLVREITRRTHRGWPTLLLLSLVYALLLEGCINQTLFNPNYAGQHLLAYGFIPALGTSLDFSIYVLTLHVVWSIGSSVALAEGLAGAHWHEPWLRLPGFIVTALLCVLGLVATAAFTLRTFHFVASPAQFAAVAIIAMALVTTAFAVFRGNRASRDGESTPRGRRAPSVWLVLVVALVLSSAFQQWYGYAPRHDLHPAIALAGLLSLEIVAVALFAIWSRRPEWGPEHVLAASAGAIATDGWISLRRLVVAGGTSLGVPTTPIDVVGQAGLLAVMLGLAYLALRWLRCTKDENGV